MKNVKFLITAVAFIALLASCKKTTVTNASTLEGHKWVLTADATTYSDSVGVSHNNIYVSPTCLDTTYYEFQDYTPNSPTRVLYQYTSEHCTNTSYNSPNISLGTWSLDNDNSNLNLNGNWFAIKTLSGSTLVLTQSSEQVSTYVGSYPNQVAVYHTITETITYTAQ